MAGLVNVDVFSDLRRVSGARSSVFTESRVQSSLSFTDVVIVTLNSLSSLAIIGTFDLVRSWFCVNLNSALICSVSLNTFAYDCVNLLVPYSTYHINYK